MSYELLGEITQKVDVVRGQSRLEIHCKTEPKPKSFEIMRRAFNSHDEALAWIIQNVDSEAQFEALHEDLSFNHSATREYFIYNLIEAL